MTTLYADAHYLLAKMLRRTVRTADGCWFFTGATNSRGYGIVCSGRKGKSVLTHRLVVIARDGSIPEGMSVDHQCHDSHTCRADKDCPHRRCVNPAHLKVMTVGENAARRWESGLCAQGHKLTRRARGERRQRECLVCKSDYVAERYRAMQSPVDNPSASPRGSTVEGRGGRSVTSPDRRLVATWGRSA